MFLLSYSYRDHAKGDGWDISNINFTKNNLFVGVSGSNKSRMLNSLMNLDLFITQNIFRDGLWEIKFITNNSTYKWALYSVVIDSEQIIRSEKLSLCIEGCEDTIIFNRDESVFDFNGQKLPKLPKNSTGLNLLKEESLVKPAYEGFGEIYRRNFFGSDLVEACSITNVPPELLDKTFYKKSKGLIGNATLHK